MNFPSFKANRIAVALFQLDAHLLIILTNLENNNLNFHLQTKNLTNVLSYIETLVRFSYTPLFVL